MKWFIWLAHQFYPQRNYWVTYMVYNRSLERNVYGQIVLVIRGRFSVDNATAFIHQFNNFANNELVVLLSYKRTHWWSDRVPKMKGVQR